MSSLQVRGGSRGDGWSSKHLVWGSIVMAPLPSLPAQGDRGLQGAVGENGEKVNAARGGSQGPGGSGARLGCDPFCFIRENVEPLAQWDPR